jgi:hypothetical protein
MRVYRDVAIESLSVMNCDIAGWAVPASDLAALGLRVLKILGWIDSADRK